MKKVGTIGTPRSCGARIASGEENMGAIGIGIPTRGTTDQRMTTSVHGEKGEKMPIKGENGGYKYKAFFNGEWHDLTLSDSPNELTEWLQSSEEWTRVKHGHWINTNEGIWNTVDVLKCSVCGEIDNRMYRSDAYCPSCGAKMEAEDETD